MGSLDAARFSMTGTSLLDHFIFTGGSTPGLEGGLSASRDPARRPVRHDRRRRELRRALGAPQARVPAPAPGVPARRALARHAEPRAKRLAGRGLFGVLHGLGREPARERARHRGHRRQDLAPGQARGGPPPPPRLRLGDAPASRPRPEAVATKGNEITAIPLLLERLEPTGALVTLDAIGCQHDMPKRSGPEGPTTSWPSRTTGRPWPRRAGSSSTPRLRPPSTPT